MKGLPNVPQPETASARWESARTSPTRRSTAGVGELVLFPERPHPDAPPEPLADADYEETGEFARILRESRRYRLAVMRRDRKRRTTPGRLPGETTR